ELDKTLTKCGYPFVRYADDFSIYCKRPSHARAMMQYVKKYLRKKLQLPINKEKSGIRKPYQFELLGFGFASVVRKGTKGRYQLVVSKKAWRRLKQRLKWATRKTSPLT